MQIQDVLFAPGYSAFYFDDQRAIKRGATRDGHFYLGDVQTSGFSAVRQGGECVSILLLLDDGQIAVGDCAAVQYSGCGGRDPLFVAAEMIPLLEEHLRPRLIGREIEEFRTLVDEYEQLEINGDSLHTAVRYGLSQALLDAVAKTRRTTPCEVVCEEWSLPVDPAPVEIFAQSGDDRYTNVDKMILKRADVLPHALINNVAEKLGYRGELLREYIAWLSGRIHSFRTTDDYHPRLHIDVYGTIGTIFDNDIAKVSDYLASLQSAAGGLDLAIEGPVDMEARGPQIEALGAIRDRLATLGSDVKIVADEWCNTLEDICLFADAGCCDMVQIKTPDLGGLQDIVDAVLYCKTRNIAAYQGGTCNETDVSARLCVHLAMATKPAQILAKPGMGFDEGFTITGNEMRRLEAILAAKTRKATS